MRTYPDGVRRPTLDPGAEAKAKKRRVRQGARCLEEGRLAAAEAGLERSPAGAAGALSHGADGPAEVRHPPLHGVERTLPPVRLRARARAQRARHEAGGDDGGPGFIDQCKRIDEALITAARCASRRSRRARSSSPASARSMLLRGRGRQFVGRIASVLGVEVGTTSSHPACRAIARLAPGWMAEGTARCTGSRERFGAPPVQSSCAGRWSPRSFLTVGEETHPGESHGHRPYSHSQRRRSSRRMKRRRQSAPGCSTSRRPQTAPTAPAWCR
jgi:hypothetical protein